jgi:glycosyltransferase involved in cell wall biosynthesis
MPVYNGAAYLEETLESVRAQTFEDFELVAIDDASTDGSRDLLSRYASTDSRIRVRRHAANRGHRAASNHAMALARGRYVARLDQDDVSLPHRLETQVAFMEEHPEIGLAASSYLRLFPDGRTARRDPPGDHPEIRWRLLFGMIFCHSTLMFRRETMRPYRYAPAAYDYEICARLARETRTASIPEPLVVYRMHEAGLSTTQRGPMERSVRAISAREIRKILAPRRPDRGEIESLRRLADGRGVEADDLERIPLMLELLDALARTPGIEPGAMAGVRRVWIRRLLRALPARHLMSLPAGRETRMLLRSDPAAVAASALAQLPRRALRTVLPRPRSST